MYNKYLLTNISIVNRQSNNSSLLFICFFWLCLFFQAHTGLAQTKSRRQLEREKVRNLEKITASKKILEDTKEQKQSTLGQLKALNNQIASQTKQIDLIEEDLQLIDLEMQEIGQISQKLKQNLRKLQTEYGEMLFAASKPSNQLNKLAFLFSAESFNQLLMRYQYLQQYTETRKAQSKQMIRVGQLLNEKQQNLVSKKSNKEQVIKQKVEKTENLKELQTQQGQVVQELTQKEKELRTEIAERQQSVDKLEGLIKNVIEREIARKNRERERRADQITRQKQQTQRPKNQSQKAPEPEPEEEIEVERSSFGSAKGHLPFPVKGGFISGRFGIHEHDVLKGVLERNVGVDIQTEKNANVRVVYEGIVRDIANVPGLNYIVAVQHGDYFTVYTKLKSVSVSVGQRIKAKENIGAVANIKGISEINFQIWNGKTAQNPESWLGN